MLPAPLIYVHLGSSQRFTDHHRGGNSDQSRDCEPLLAEKKERVTETSQFVAEREMEWATTHLIWHFLSAPAICYSSSLPCERKTMRHLVIFCQRTSLRNRYNQANLIVYEYKQKHVLVWMFKYVQTWVWLRGVAESQWAAQDAGRLCTKGIYIGWASIRAKRYYTNMMLMLRGLTEIMKGSLLH